MQVVMAESYGMCFGVRDAVALAMRTGGRQELTVLGELVHNPEVLRRLRGAGIESVADTRAPVRTAAVMITAHGAADREVLRLREQGLQVVDATCPLVRHAHRSLRRLVEAGYYPVVIGREQHVEVQGLVGDLDEVTVLESEADICRLPARPRYGVISQTTQPLARVLQLVEAMRRQLGEAEVRFLDTVCQPTKDRQAAAQRMAATCAVIVVVGGRESNNTRQLVRTCEAGGARVYQVEGPEELCREWFMGVECVGLTAGTSTPEDVVQAVRAALERLETAPARGSHGRRDGDERHFRGVRAHRRCRGRHFVSPGEGCAPRRLSLLVGRR